MFLKEVSYADHDWIYLMENAVKPVILWTTCEISILEMVSIYATSRMEQQHTNYDVLYYVLYWILKVSNVSLNIILREIYSHRECNNRVLVRSWKLFKANMYIKTTNSLRTNKSFP